MKLTDNKTSDYDRKDCYQANYHHGSSAVIPPQRNGQYRAGTSDYLLKRNKSLLEIKGLGGGEDARKLCKKLRGYHRRSLAETGMYRFKTLFGGDLNCRMFQGQQSEAYAKAIPNVFQKPSFETRSV